MIHSKIRPLTVWIGLLGLLPATSAAAMTMLHCGTIFTGEFSKADETHEYGIDMQPGESLEIEVVPEGEFLKYNFEVLDPTDYRLDFVYRTHKVSKSVGRLSARGAHKIRLTSYNAGLYYLHVGCVRADGTEVPAQPAAPPTAMSPPPSSSASSAVPRTSPPATDAKQVLIEALRRLDADQLREVLAEVLAGQGAAAPAVALPSPAPPPTPRRGVTLCEHADYGGRCETLYADDATLADNEVGDDQVSSLRVDAGCRAILYRRPGFGGKLTTATANVPNLRGSEVGNDEVSSVRVSCR